MSRLEFIRPFLSASVLVFGTPAFASHGPVLGEVTAAGTGCPGGAVDVRLESQWGSTLLQIQLPDSYRASTSQGRSLDRKACALLMPIEVPAGRRLVVVQSRMNTTVKTATGGEIQLAAEVFSPGRQGMKMERTIESTSSRPFNANLRGQDVFAGECGSSVPLRMNTSVVAKGAGSTVQAKNATLRLVLEPCQEDESTVDL